MKPIDFKGCFAEILSLSEAKPGSHRYKSTMKSVINFACVSPRVYQNNKSMRLFSIQTGVIMVLLAIATLASQAGKLSDAAETAFIVAVVLCIAIFMALYRRMRLNVQREIEQNLDILLPRIRALPEAEMDSALDLLNTEPSYLRKLPTESEAPCGCIRCQAFFPARNIPWIDARRFEGRCPQCGAPTEYLVFPDDGFEVMPENLALLHTLFDEEN